MEPRRRNDPVGGIARNPLRSVYNWFPPKVREFIDRAYDALLPVRDEKILITDEEILYKSRRHVAETVKPGLAFVGSLLIFLALSFQPFALLGTLGVVAVGASLVIAVVDRERDDIRGAIIGAIPFVAFGLLLAYVFDNPQLILFGLLLWVMGTFGVRLLRWRFFRVLYLTNRRLIQTEGFISRRQATLPLSRVTDVALSYSFLGEYLNYATFRVESAGQTLFQQIDFLASPEEFHQMVVELATSPRKLPDVDRVIDPGLLPRRPPPD